MDTMIKQQGIDKIVSVLIEEGLITNNVVEAESAKTVLIHLSKGTLLPIYLPDNMMREKETRSLLNFTFEGILECLNLPKNVAKGNWEKEAAELLREKVYEEMGEFTQSIINNEGVARVKDELTDLILAAAMYRKEIHRDYRVRDVE